MAFRNNENVQKLEKDNDWTFGEYTGIYWIISFKMVMIMAFESNLNKKSNYISL
jgi:hypothetical protein